MCIPRYPIAKPTTTDYAPIGGDVAPDTAPGATNKVKGAYARKMCAYGVTRYDRVCANMGS